MKIDRKEVLDILMRITPDDAQSEEALRVASQAAVEQLDEAMHLADEAAKGALGYHAKMDHRVRFLVKDLVRRRKNALIHAGAYRTAKVRAAEHRAFYG
jgi:hypothetical protein